MPVKRTPSNRATTPIKKSLNYVDWTEINEALQSGTFESVLWLGRKKDVYNRCGRKIGTVELVAFNHDEMESGERTMTTWVATTSTIQSVMNSASATYCFGSNVGGWEKSEARSFLNDYLFDQLSEDLRQVIKPVVKISDTGYHRDVKKRTSLCQTVDKLFLPSCAELGFDHPSIIPGQGTCYPGFTDKFKTMINKRCKRKDGKIYGENAWLRSSLISMIEPADAYSSADTEFGADCFWSIDPDGGLCDYTLAFEDFILPFAFCI